MTKHFRDFQGRPLETLPTEKLLEYWISEFEAMNDLPMTSEEVNAGREWMAAIDTILEARDALH